MPKAKENSIYNTGKRKEAIARIKMSVTRGGAMQVNDKAVADYFPGEYARLAYLKAFSTLGLDPNEYTISLKIVGGGKASQLEAASKAVAKALLTLNPEYRERLKKARLLHRDPRVKERRKFGLAGKARAKKQSPKR